ncbi:MAG: nicotinate-nucleotide adenylyltransferase [Gammaproteobacteria bacterium]|nr:nicotinate-nucleotide adenylyltransferase [Gammaproteobacteria bacterium]
MIGILGGTFDPIHNGHLQTARDLLDELKLDQIRFIPCGVPPHRDAPVATPAQRLAMLQAAVSHEPGFVVDDRELRREGPSYMVDTLISLRSELGPELSLGLILGLDAFLELESWDRWQQLTELAHLIVMTRPAYERPAWLSTGLQNLLAEHETRDRESCNKRPAGDVIFCTVSAMDISSTRIRQGLRDGAEVSDMLPSDVLTIIRQEQIYFR